jgi:hypothetical protein
MGKTKALLIFFAALALSARATVVGFDQPVIGHIVTNTTFDDGWNAALNTDNNPEGSGANVYWYPSPPNGFNSQYEPDPALIRSALHTGGTPDKNYFGGAVWLDGTATDNGGIFQVGQGVDINQTFGTVVGERYTLSWYQNTEVTPLNLPANNLKGSPAGTFLFIDGHLINSGVADGSFLSKGLPPILSGPSLPSDTDWTKYVVSFTGTGADKITFEDDLSLIGEKLGLTNGLFSSNAVVADIQLVPETGWMLTLALVAAFIGFAAYRRRVIHG